MLRGRTALHDPRGRLRRRSRPDEREDLRWPVARGPYLAVVTYSPVSLSPAAVTGPAAPHRRPERPLPSTAAVLPLAAVAASAAAWGPARTGIRMPLRAPALPEDWPSVPGGGARGLEEPSG